MADETRRVLEKVELAIRRASERFYWSVDARDVGRVSYSAPAVAPEKQLLIVVAEEIARIIKELPE